MCRHQGCSGSSAGPTYLRWYQQENINEGTEEGECSDRAFNQIQREAEEELQSANRALIAANGRMTERNFTTPETGMGGTNYGCQSRHSGAPTHQGGRMRSMRESSRSPAERPYHEEGRMFSDRQSPDVYPNFQGSISGSPHHANFHEGGSYTNRPFCEHDLNNREERLPARASPQSRRSVSPRAEQFVPGGPPSHYEARPRVEYDNIPMNEVAQFNQPYRESTAYYDIQQMRSSFPNSRDQSQRESPFSPDSLEAQNFSPDSLEAPGSSSRGKSRSPNRPATMTPQQYTYGENEEEYENRGGATFPTRTFNKAGPSGKCTKTQMRSDNFHITPSPYSGASNAVSYGKFALSNQSQKDLGASPPFSYVGGSPQGNREALAQLAQFTVTKSAPPPCRRALDFKKATDFFPPCDTGSGIPNRKLPKKPELSQEEIKELIEIESQDVDCAWLLTSDQKKTYKKPCPKQQKAQMTVKHIVEVSQKTISEPCGKEYPPLLEPEPEDLSPEVAAAMMFSQEQGIKLDSCPDETVKHLFPSEGFRRLPPSKISIVDSNQKDQAEMIEKSAAVPSEGVSDSAYTRTMKQKGDEIPSQKSYDLDFALGQEKREVVLVPQRPKRFNTIQFRGNLTPWFPGYFSAFPDQADPIKIVPSPSKLFLKAWIMTNPANVPASDVIVIE